ncbi:GNAT family N-acetyltransferase [Halalkalicoccus jeotgali]|uniref:GCN5-like N-acetyltransferase n=1 Tax=Halalkalicoccus jeotgali (strain DSM 18796 / CECT 7217 / JCM 14584 / KCTC 4019 / B3) TaxID=795797 RepID=D8J8F2_HALJB|nr:GNAT family N-acetyltransferase [Halalkalicoccus jeotgali]ADJ16198.1 GCN5-related N-acetyltransferase [Halalkalicoccus jeotgali B3]ELY37626.1 GCN5-like N-acetyltransferase [Halalkalicoccus jeotgali B3]
MYVRGAKKREEVWLLDEIERLGLDEAAFRSREYVIALDEETGEKAGFGRLRLYDEVCEITSLGVAEAWRGQGVGAHVTERLVDHAGDEGFERVYALAPEPDYLLQFGFEPIERSGLPEPLGERLDAKREHREEVIATALATESFSMPERLRERFKAASPAPTGDESEETLPPEEFGIDPDTATYKYDTGRQ